MNKQNKNTIKNLPPPGGDNGSVPETIVTGAMAANVEMSPAAMVPVADDPEIALLKTENEQLKATIRTAEAHRQITGELASAGARSPGLLFDSVKADLQFAEDGRPANAAALIERLKKSFPEQFGLERATSSIDAGSGRTVLPQLSKERLAKMKPAEIARLDWADVRRVLSQ